jgi:HEAT repeat protein
VRDPGESAESRVEGIRRLGKDSPEDRREEVRGVMIELLRTDPAEAIRGAALDALVDLGLESAYYDVLDVFQNDTSLQIRRQALAHLVGIEGHEAEMQDSLLSALRDLLPPDLQPIREDVLREIAKNPREEDLGALLDVFHGSPEGDPVREEISKTLGSYRFHSTVDALIEMLRMSGPRVRQSASASLRTLTGQSIPYDPSMEEDPMLLEEMIGKWETWWAENRDTFEFN